MLQTAKFFGTIEDALATKADQAVKINTLGGLADLCRIVGRACEPFIIPLLTPVLLAAGDKVRHLQSVCLLLHYGLLCCTVLAHNSAL